MRTVIGVDAGGTSTRAVLVDEQGTCLGLGRSGAGNPVSAGHDKAIASVAQACQQAMAGSSGASVPELVLVSMAGGSTIGGRLAGLAEALRQAGVESPVQMASDSMSTYFSATTDPDGGVLIAGTGAVAVAVRDGAAHAVVDGAGWLIGDDGSGFWLGRAVVHAVVAALDGRGPATSLTEAVLSMMPPSTVDVLLPTDAGRSQIVRAVYAHKPIELARYAPLALEQAASDEVAARLVDQAVILLRHTADTLLAQVPHGPVVLGGGVAGSLIGDRLAEHLGERGRRAKDGTVGAAVLALRALHAIDQAQGRAGAGGQVGEQIRERLLATLPA